MSQSFLTIGVTGFVFNTILSYSQGYLLVRLKAYELGYL